MKETHTLPQHIAIIMDGNGRWAKKRCLPRVAGHKAGLETARNIIEHCIKKKIKVVSLFVFSSENWQRPEEEVSYLMNLFITALKREAKKLHEQGVQFRVIGDQTRFDEKLRIQIKETEKLTADNKRLTLLLAANYGGQWDITQAFSRLAKEIEASTLKSNDITPKLIEKYLSFPDLPHPDLFIRTSGEMRISNFMLWQLSYAELYFTEVLWPDFDENELDQALLWYATKERRFGLTSEQLTEDSHA
jgi:undecaprenyl diphosphate synthase